MNARPAIPAVEASASVPLPMADKVAAATEAVGAKPADVAAEPQGGHGARANRAAVPKRRAATDETARPQYRAGRSVQRLVWPGDDPRTFLEPRRRRVAGQS